MNKWHLALEFDKILDEIQQGCAFSLGKKEIDNLVPAHQKKAIQRDNLKTLHAMNYILSGNDASLSGVSDVTLFIEKAAKGAVLSIDEMVSINKTNHVVARLIKNEKYPDAFYVNDYIESLSISLKLIQRIDESFSPNNDVLDSASSLYRSLKKQQRELESGMQAQVQSFINKNMAWLSEPIATTRHDRVVVLAKAADKNKFKGIVHGESASGQSAYVEPPFLIALNNQKESIASQIEAEVYRICIEISTLIQQESNQLLANLDTLAKLDAMFAKAKWGLARNGFVAEVDDNLPISIVSARHPFIDPAEVVANTIEITPPNRILLITGPNTGGKTVSVKIIGLFTLMAYSGIPVLASQATFPVFDKVFADIGDDQSIVQSLSTFSSHLSKIAQILEESTSNSLVLLDELGSGTDPDEGESLAIAILDYLKEKQCVVVATTHFNRLKEVAYQSKHTMLASVEFDIKNLKPTYRYVSNTSGSSNALAIAARFHLPQKLLDNAQTIYLKKQSEQQQLIDKLHQKIQKQQALVEESEALKKQHQHALEQIQSKEKQLEATKEKVLQDAQEKAQEYLKEQLAYVDELVAQAIKADQQQAKSVQKKLQTKVEKPQPQSAPKNLAVGDYVLINATHQVGVITNINNKQLDVEVNGKRFVVQSKNVTLSKAPQRKQQATRQSRIEAPKSVDMECVIVGMRSEEAKVKVDQYINDCILANRSVGYIVHGVGTGVLKKVINQYLNNHPGIKQVKPADHQQGGAAVTVVTF